MHLHTLHSLFQWRRRANSASFPSGSAAITTGGLWRAASERPASTSTARATALRWSTGRWRPTSTATRSRRWRMAWQGWWLMSRQIGEFINVYKRLTYVRIYTEQTATYFLLPKSLSLSIAIDRTKVHLMVFPAC